MTRAARMTLGALAVVGLIAGAYLAGRASVGRSSRDPRPDERSAAAPQPETPARPASRGIRSVFDARFALAPTPEGGLDAVVVSDRASECLDECPAGVRAKGPPEAAATRALVVASIESLVDELVAAADAADPAFAAALRTSRAHATTAADGLNPRVFAVRMDRSDAGRGLSQVLLAVYNHCDPFFDARRATDCPRGGAHLVVSRIDETPPTGRPSSLLAGFVEAETRSPRDVEPVRETSETAEILLRAAGPIYAHFSQDRGEVRGLFLSPDGQIYAYDRSLRMSPIDAGPELRAALEALLRRA